MSSVWNISDIPHFDALKNDEITTDVLIIGGGIAGILCAYMLKKRNINYILVEANTIFNSVSGNTTAKITSQHGLIYNKLIKKFGENFAKLYFDANQDAISDYCNLAKEIDCDFEIKNNYVYSINNRKKIDEELKALSKIKIQAEFRKNLFLPLSVAGAVEFKNQAQFNPVKFILGIIKDLNIYENTKVIDFNDKYFITNYGKIMAEKTIIATHFPFINSHGCYFLKMYQHRSYVIAIKNSTNLNGMYVDENDTGMSFRNYKDMLFLGGGGHRTGKKGGGYIELKNFADKHYPNNKIISKWATQDCITLDSAAYIGKYSKNTPNIFVATGFNKWGMTTSMVAAKLLCDLILEIDNPYAELFSPSRTILRPQLFVNSFETLSNFILPTVPRCSHLGCALKWNRQEHSWDCSCHGSRFSQDGDVINNPANKKLK